MEQGGPKKRLQKTITLAKVKKKEKNSVVCIATQKHIVIMLMGICSFPCMLLWITLSVKTYISLITERILTLKKSFLSYKRYLTNETMPRCHYKQKVMLTQKTNLHIKTQS